MGRAASPRNCGRRVAAVLSRASDRARGPQRLDLDLDPAGTRVLIVAPQVPMRQMVDVVATRVFGPVDHPALDLRPPEHLLRVDQEQRDAWVALEVIEPAAIGAADDPQ